MPCGKGVGRVWIKENPIRLSANGVIVQKQNYYCAKAGCCFFNSTNSARRVLSSIPKSRAYLSKISSRFSNSFVDNPLCEPSQLSVGRTVPARMARRSEERRVGEGGRSRWS